MRSPQVAVIGAGVAGTASALELAKFGFTVYLLEREATVGGTAASLSCKATDECSACSVCAACELIREAATHPGIRLLTSTAVQNVSGEGANFQIEITRKATYVDMNRCIACGLCTQMCPTNPKAIRPSSIWLPLPYIVDDKLCLNLKGGNCSLCRESCPTTAIEFGSQPQRQKLAVDAIVVATGFDVFDAGRKGSLGYGRYPNVLSGMDAEKAHRQKGALKLADGREAKEVAFIQCVGSRDESCGNGYCSQVCCKYAMRLARLIKYQKPEAQVTIFYIDLQTAGKGFSEFYERWRDSIRFVRGVPVEVSDESDHKLKVRFEDFSQAKPVEEDFDMVILSVGITARSDAWGLARVLGINVDEFGFFDSEDGVTTNVDNVFLAGTCQGPKDIPDSIAHGMAAAKKVIESLSVKKQSS